MENNMKKTIAAFLMLALAFSFTFSNVPVVASTADIPESDSTVTIGSDTWTVIRSASDLKGATSSGKYILANDISFSDEIQTETVLTVAGGTTIDGNGHSILGLKGSGAALFALADSAAEIVIKDLTFGSKDSPVAVTGGKGCSLFANDTKNNVVTWTNVHFYSSVTSTGSTECYSGVVFSAMSGKHTFTECTVDAVITQSAAGAAATFAGILKVTGVINAVGCSSAGSVAANGNASGFVGEMQGSCTVSGFTNNAIITSSGHNAGGIVGYAKISYGVVRDFSDCVNYGSVKAKSAAGGIYGCQNANETANAKITFTSCKNFGTVALTDPNIYQGVGGIYGLDDGKCNALTLTFDGCENHGNVVGSETCCGGILGRSTAGPKVRSCVNYAPVSGKADVTNTRVGGIAGNFWSKASVLENDINYGAVSAGNHLGGIVGQSEAGATIRNCVNFGSISRVKNNGGGIVGTTGGNLNIENCANHGKMRSATTGGAVGTGGGNVKLKSFLNTGSLNGFSHTGGFFGWTNAQITVEDSANIGTLSGSSNIGGFVGVVNVDTMKVKNSFAFGNIIGTAANVGPFAGTGSKDFASAESLAYIEPEKAGNSKGVGETAASSPESSVALLESMFPDMKFTLNEQNAPVIASPILRGVQNTEPEDGTYRVRFIIALNTANYTKIGYTLKYSYMNGTEKVEFSETKYGLRLYKSINAAAENGQMGSVKPEDLFGSYLCALTVDGLPVSVGEITFELTPIVETETAVFNGETKTVRYNAGQYVGQ